MSIILLTISVLILCDISEGSTIRTLKQFPKDKNISILEALGLEPKGLKNFTDDNLLKYAFETVLDSAENFVKTVIYNLWSKSLNVPLSNLNLPLPDAQKVGIPDLDTEEETKSEPKQGAGVSILVEHTSSKIDKSSNQDLFLNSIYTLLPVPNYTDNKTQIYEIMKSGTGPTTDSLLIYLPGHQDEEKQETDSDFEVQEITESSLNEISKKIQILEVTTEPPLRLALEPCIVLDMLNFVLKCTSLKPETSIKTNLVFKDSITNSSTDVDLLKGETKLYPETVNDNWQKEIPTESNLQNLYPFEKKTKLNLLHKKTLKDVIFSMPWYDEMTGITESWKSRTSHNTQNTKKELQSITETLEKDILKPWAMYLKPHKARNKSLEILHEPIINHNESNLKLLLNQNSNNMKKNSAIYNNKRNFRGRNYKKMKFNNTLYNLENDLRKEMKWKGFGGRNNTRGQPIQNNLVLSIKTNKLQEEPIKIHLLNGMNDNVFDNINEDYHPNIKKILQYLIKINQKKRAKLEDLQ